METLTATPGTPASDDPSRIGDTAVEAPPEPEPTPEPTPPPPDAEWRQRGKQARGAITDAEKRVAEIQGRIDALRADLGVNDATDPNREQNRQARITAATRDLEDARAVVANARQALQELEDEARRAQVPSGWLRDY